MKTNFTLIFQIDLCGVISLRANLHTLRPEPAMRHGMPATYVPKELQTATHVFVRCDTHTTLLKCPYDGPFKVLARKEKYFLPELRGRTDKVSIDQLKPACLHDLRCHQLMSKRALDAQGNHPLPGRIQGHRENQPRWPCYRVTSTFWTNHPGTSVTLPRSSYRRCWWGSV